jgi:hypothetical protein
MLQLKKLFHTVGLILFTGCLINVYGSVTEKSNNDLFQRKWKHTSETSAVIYWTLDEISKSANSLVEYGETRELGKATAETGKPRWAHFHRLNGLEPGTKYYYRMVVVDPDTRQRKESEIFQLKPGRVKKAVYISQDIQGNPPYVLDREDENYVLTEDIIADGTAFIIQATGILLDMDGHTVTFGNNTSEQVFGVQIINEGSCKVVNGKIVQGAHSADYSAAVRSYKNNPGTEICGISTDVHLPNAHPMMFRHDQLSVHHNDIYSRVTELESRHYPGNALLMVYARGENVFIHDNLLTEGCHRGIIAKELRDQTLNNLEIHHNDIQHHQQYVNGYAIAPGSGAKVHHNRVTSTGRAVHLTGQGTEFYENFIDTKGHMHLSDLPARTRPFHHRLIELHGIKFEGSNTRNCKIHDNFVRIIQHQPAENRGVGDPADKMENGVYIKSEATSVENGKLVDNNQNWEKDRWRYYYIKYDSDKPPVRIAGNDSHTLYGNFEATDASEYTVFMKWSYVAPTPLNIACYNPNGMNEVYNNTFIGITTYKDTRHGSYGDSGEWATSIMFVGMNKGPADSGKYSAYIHDNEFYSNDLFINSHTKINMNIRLESNTFNLLDEPFTTKREHRIRNVGEEFENKIINGNNELNE